MKSADVTIRTCTLPIVIIQLCAILQSYTIIPTFSHVAYKRS